jgi:arylsulfatase
MQNLFRTEAARNQVFPLDDRMSLARFEAAQGSGTEENHFVYWGPGISVPSASAPSLFARGFRIAAQIDLPEGGATGPLVALGSKFGGWSFYLKEGRPVALMAASQQDGDQSRIAAAQPLRPGRTSLVFDFRYAGGVNAGGELVILANGSEIARGPIARTMSKLPELTDTLDIGFDASTPVTDDYPRDKAFTGGITKVEITLGKAGAPGGAP